MPFYRDCLFLKERPVLEQKEVLMLTGAFLRFWSWAVSLDTMNNQSERKTDVTDTERQRHRQKQRQRQRHGETDRQRQTDTERDRETERL